MEIIEKLLTVNKYSRPGTLLAKKLAYVPHWTANPGQNWYGVQQFFEDRKDGHLVNGQHDYGSAHYVIGFKGEIIQMIPEGEVAYHVGSSKLDPASGKDYTDLARQKFGIYATDYIDYSPNLVCIGTEHCVLNDAGEMTTETIESAITLAVQVCRWANLNPMMDILLHNEIVGWKNCHKFWIDHPDNWYAFKAAVASRM